MSRRLKSAVLGSIAVLVVFGFRSVGFAGVFFAEGATTLHFAFEGNPNGDRPVVRPPAFYQSEDGFGFVNSPTLSGTSRGVTAPGNFRFDANLPAGNYDVTIMFGGTEEDSISTVKAQQSRPMLLDVVAARGKTATKMFTVNVAEGTLNPWLQSPGGRLSLEFVGSNPSLMKLDIRRNEEATTVYIVGDTTASDKVGIPLAGWGQMLPLLFKPGMVAIANCAWPGLTGEAFAGRFGPDFIGKKLKAGDYLLVQFDAAKGGAASLDDSRSRTLLKSWIEVARAQKATPVFISATPPRLFDANGNVAKESGTFARTVRDIAQQETVVMIDLNAGAVRFLEKLGVEKSAGAYTNYHGRWTVHPLERIENGNLSPYGAYEFAKLVAQGMIEQKSELASQLVEDIATNWDPAKFPENLRYESREDDK